jgi:hypothetical protein
VEIDQGIKSLNKYVRVNSEINDLGDNQILPNTFSLAPLMKDKSFPDLSSLLSPPIDMSNHQRDSQTELNFHGFRRTCKIMALEMIAGEMTRRDIVPFLPPVLTSLIETNNIMRFHIAKENPHPEAVTVGVILHLLETHFHLLYPKIPRELILDSLLEVMIWKYPLPPAIHRDREILFVDLPKGDPARHINLEQDGSVVSRNVCATDRLNWILPYEFTPNIKELAKKISNQFNLL